MPRYRLDIAYDGTEYHGWAAQLGLRTVQGEIEGWLGRILGKTQPISLVVAGRTDAGVHARGQVAHFDLPDEMPEPINCEDLLRRLHCVLPADIVVNRVSIAPAGFDARFAAIWRRYCYRIWDLSSTPDPLLRRMVTPITDDLDTSLMDEAAKSLLGLRDFTPFCKRREGATSIRNLMRFDIRRLDDRCNTVEATLVADAFCHSMVRSLMGAVVSVGSGKRDLAWLGSVASSPNRANGVPVLAPQGLTLEEVGYPDEDELVARVRVARARRDEAAGERCEDYLGGDAPKRFREDLIIPRCEAITDAVRPLKGVDAL